MRPLGGVRGTLDQVIDQGEVLPPSVHSRRVHGSGCVGSGRGYKGCRDAARLGRFEDSYVPSRHPMVTPISTSIEAYGPALTYCVVAAADNSFEGTVDAVGQNTGDE